MNIEYYFVDTRGKHRCSTFEDVLRAVNERINDHLGILKECGRHLDIKVRRIENKDENILEIYAFVFSDERGAI